MKYIFTLGMLLSMGFGSLNAQSYFDDDIYYNPKKDSSASSTSKSKKSNYIANMGDMDVDVYNRRGESYYVSAIDTIGARVESGEDFVYTQQIQKYYNPTIVVDNADVLGDILSDAYGNVEIVINNNGLPVFSPYYGWNSYYNPWYWSPLSWNLSFGGWGWNIGFYDPWYSWGWGPSWGWNPGPPPPPGGWGPGGWRPGSWGGRPFANWRPAGNRPVGLNPGWGVNTRPGGNYNPGMPGVPPGGPGRPAAKPGLGGNNSCPNPGSQLSGRPSGVVNNNGQWQYNTSGSTGHRVTGTGALSKPSGMKPATAPTQNQNSTTRPSTSTNNKNSAVSRPSSTTNSTSKSPAPSVNQNRNNSTNRVSTPNRSGVSRPSSSGASRVSGGGGGARGRHR